MARRLEYVKDQASQRLYFDAALCDDPRGRGRPSSTPSVQIKTKGGSTVVSLGTTNVTQESVNTTIATSAAAGVRSLVLTSGTGVTVGDTYRAENHIGQVEWLRVASLNSATITLDEATEYAYSVDGGGGTFGSFDSTRWYYTLQAADVDTLDELYVAVSTYAYDSLNHELRQTFDVVRHPLVNPLTVEAVKRHRPDIMRQAHTEQRGEDFAEQREAAWDICHRKLRANGTGWRPAWVVSGASDLELWALWELGKLLQESGVEWVRGFDDRGEALEYIGAQLGQAETRAMGSIAFLDKDESESRSEDEGEEATVTMDFVR